MQAFSSISKTLTVAIKRQPQIKWQQRSWDCTVSRAASARHFSLNPPSVIPAVSSINDRLRPQYGAAKSLSEDRFTHLELTPVSCLPPPAAPPCGVSRAVHPASPDPVPPLWSDAGAAASSHALQTLLCTQLALQTLLRARLHTAWGESHQDSSSSCGSEYIFFNLSG